MSESTGRAETVEDDDEERGTLSSTILRKLLVEDESQVVFVCCAGPGGLEYYVRTVLGAILPKDFWSTICSRVFESSTY